MSVRKKVPFFYYMFIFFSLEKLEMSVVESGMGNDEILSNDAWVKYSRPVTKGSKVQFVLARY